jgi:hypothetical protein
MMSTKSFNMRGTSPVFFNIAHFFGRSIRDALQSVVGSESVFGRRKIFDDSVHLDAAMTWLRRSIEANGGAGSSHSFIIGKGWRPAYPETTGYILKTFLRFSDRRDREQNVGIARQLADWLITVQLPDGGIPGLDLGRIEGANVFNTGMVLLGWNAIYLRTSDRKYLGPAQAAGDFLLTCLDDNGCFARHTSYGLAHSYNVRAAWALLELGRITKNERYVEGAESNLRWTLLQKMHNGFFRNNVFVPGGRALTHSIGYVLSGLVEFHLLTGNREALESAVTTIQQLHAIYTKRGRIAAELGENFEALSNHICIVGYCQIAIVLLQIYKVTNNSRYRDFAIALIDDAKATQELGSVNAPWYGAIPGSFPIYGRYARLQYPNWATKFFADALLLKIKMTPA